MIKEESSEEGYRRCLITKVGKKDDEYRSVPCYICVSDNVNFTLDS